MSDLNGMEEAERKLRELLSQRVRDDGVFYVRVWNGECDTMRGPFAGRTEARKHFNEAMADSETTRAEFLHVVVSGKK